MPSFAESLEATLHNALKHAGDRALEYATLEHLLLALIDDADAAKVMQACGVDLGELSDIIITYLDTELESLRVEGKVDPSPTSGFQRVVQRFNMHVCDFYKFCIGQIGKQHVTRQRQVGAIELQL